MRTYAPVVAAAVLGLAFGPAVAQQAAAPAARAPQPGTLTDEFGGAPGFEVTTNYIDWAPGRTTGWHTHPGDETALMIAGELRIEIEGVPTRIVAAGDVYHNKQGQVHRTTNVGTEPARSWSVYVLKKGEPRNTNTAAPPGYPN